MIIVTFPDTWGPARRWIAKQILGRFFCEIEFSVASDHNWCIECSGRKERIILPDTFFRRASELGSIFSVLPMESSPVAEYFDGKDNVVLPLLFDNPGFDLNPNPVSGEDYYFNADIFGTAFWMMARIEEYQSILRDQHDRFSAFSSHAWRNGYITNPIVDQFVSVLKFVILALWPGVELKADVFSMNVSHDVDDPYAYQFMSFNKSVRVIAANAVRAKSIGMATKFIHGLCMSKIGIDFQDPCDTFSWLMDCSEKNGVKSDFFFIPRPGKLPVDSDYEIDHPVILNLLRHISLRGHGIGIHPTYETYKNKELMRGEVVSLKNALDKAGLPSAHFGGRMHYLRWHHEFTPQAQIFAGIGLDSTLGFADYPGFRCGTCHDFKYFDPVKQQETDLIIRPLVVMECTVMAKRYMNLGATAEAYDFIIGLKEKCRKVGGGFNILWHNSSFFSGDEKSIYVGLLSN